MACLRRTLDQMDLASSVVQRFSEGSGGGVIRRKDYPDLVMEWMWLRGRGTGLSSCLDLPNLTHR